VFIILSLRVEADASDFEYARDRIMMGIERKNLSMSERDRLATAIHESGHAITCYYQKYGNKLYKATIVARGGSLGAVSQLRLNFSDLYGSERVFSNLYEQSGNSGLNRCCDGRPCR
jgi:cell division protease FtsH